MCPESQPKTSEAWVGPTVVGLDGLGVGSYVPYS